MKSYREIADSVFERRERYIAARQRKRKHTVSAITSICSCALVALVGASVWRSGVLTEDPPLSDSLSTTTVTRSPVTEGTAVGTAPSASHSGIVSHTTTTTSVFAPSQTTPSKTQPPTATTPSKTQPPATTPSKTEPSKTNPTQPTASQTRPTVTQTQPTQTTPTTQPTVPPQENNYIVAETPLSTEGDPGPPYAISAKIPAQCNIAEETVTISLSYGPFRGLMLKPDASGCVLVKITTDNGEEIILNKIDIHEFNSSAYFVYEVWGEDGWPIAYTYSHTEMIQLPLSLCSKEKGRIWITVEDESDILGTGVPFEYTRTEASVRFASWY